MTICIQIGELETQIQKNFFLGKVNLKVKLDVSWVSCGVYSIAVTKLEETDNKYTEPKTDFCISLTPEWFDKVAELYPDAVKRTRVECYKPFYENYLPDPGMFDMCHDILFQAFKHQLEDRVILTNYHFEVGVPAKVNVLNLEFSEFIRLKELIDNKKSEIFYSGVKMSL